jgi:hypothetical protein
MCSVEHAESCGVTKPLFLSVYSLHHHAESMWRVGLCGMPGLWECVEAWGGIRFLKLFSHAGTRPAVASRTVTVPRTTSF